MKKFIINIFVSLAVTLILIWLIIAFVNWDIIWMQKLPTWETEERAGLGFFIFIITTLLTVIFEVSSDSK